MSSFMDRLICQCFVNLYVSTASLTVGVTARIKSVTQRTNLGIALYITEKDVLWNEKLQYVKSRTRTIVTGEKSKRDPFYWCCIWDSQSIPKHTWEILIRVFVDPIPNQADDTLCRSNEEENTKYCPRSIPYRINTQNHHYCDLSQRRGKLS